MKSPKVYLFVLIIIIYSCSKENDDINPTPELKFVSGQVEFIASGTTPDTGFSIELKTPTDVIYYATVADNSVVDTFVVGNKIMLKGLLIDNYLEVKKIISTNNEDFPLSGRLTSKEFNESGYSAEIEGNDGEVYQALFSISNLGEEYHEFEIDDTLIVAGSLWLIDEKLQLTVKTIN